MLNNLSIQPLFGTNCITFMINDLAFKYVFEFFVSTLWCLGKPQFWKYDDFRTVVYCLVYARIKPNDSLVVGKILDTFNGVGVMPGICRFVRLLPLGGRVILNGFVWLDMILPTNWKVDVDIMLQDKLSKAVLAMKSSSNYERFVMEAVDIHSVGTKIIYNDFFSNVLWLTKSCSFSEKDKPLCFLNTPSATPSFSSSLATAVLFNLTVVKPNLDDARMLLGSKYASIVPNEVVYSSLVNMSMLFIFGSDHAGFGRLGYVANKAASNSNQVPKTKGSSVNDGTVTNTPPATGN